MTDLTQETLPTNSYAPIGQGDPLSHAHLATHAPLSLKLGPTHPGRQGGEGKRTRPVSQPRVSTQPDLADSQAYLGPLCDQYIMINDLLPPLRAGKGGARSRSTSYYTSVVTNNNHMPLTTLSVPCLQEGQSRIDRYSTCPSATATAPTSANSASAGSSTKKARSD